MFAFRALERLGGGRARVEPFAERVELAAGLGRPREQLLGRVAPEPPSQVGETAELALDVLEAAGLGVEAVEKAPQLASRLPQPQLDVAKLVAAAGQLGRERLERRHGPFGRGGEPCRSLTLLGGERVGGGRRRGGQLPDVPQTFALCQQLLLCVGLQAGRVLGEGAQLGEPRLALRGTALELLAAPASGHELAPGGAGRCAAGRLAVADERVEHVQLVRGAGEPALLELSRHGDQPLADRREVLTRRAPAPGIRARATVGEDPAREHEPVLVLGLQLGERVEAVLVEQPVGQLQLRLDIGLASLGADERGVALPAEEQAHRLREDRLAGAGLAGDRVQAGCELELRRADEHEVLDAKPTKQRCRGSAGRR